MIVISKTPLRISFFGGGTDYPDYYNVHGGAVLGTTINQYIHISIKKRTFYDAPYRFVYSQIEECYDVDEIQHPSIRETLRYLDNRDPLEIHIFNDLPAKTGLGSSSAFTVGLLNALYAYQGKTVSSLTLAKRACHIEQQLIQEHVGSQDQCHAAFGGINMFTFAPGKLAARPLLLSDEKRLFLQEHMLLFFTGQMRFASDVAKTQITRIQERKLDGHLEEMKSFVPRAKEILETQEGAELLHAFAKLLDQSWQIKRGLTDQIANAYIDQLYEKAVDAGAYGGKLCGAGGGGMLLFVAPKERQQAVRESLHPLKEIEITFAERGSRIIHES